MKAMLVDDHPATLRLQEAMFRRAGWTTTSHSLAKPAIEAVEVWQPDVVILDLAMPDMDGLEFLVDLRLRYRCHVLVVSGFSKDRLAPVVMAFGASGYHEKGDDPGAILDSARALLGREPPPVTQREALSIRIRELI